MREATKFVLETLKIVFFALLIVIPIRYFLFEPFIVRGASMEPSFSEADYLIVDRISYRFRDPRRGEVIVFRYPRNPQKRHIKRIVGLPEERITIEGKSVYIGPGEERMLLEEKYLPSNRDFGEEEIILGEEEYFVMGDNRNSSVDSRNWGALSRDDIIGRAVIQVSPFDYFRWVDRPEYQQIAE